MGSVYTVSQVNSYIKHLFDEDFALGMISIKGEVSNCKYHSSGHIYFTLKDSGAGITAVMFAGNRKNLGFDVRDGMQVIATGSVSVYEKEGKYQLYVRQMIDDGQGDLFRRFEALKKELDEMGMFDAAYKKPVPKYAMRIGVVTSPTGAAIRDIVNIATRRNPYVQLILCPALVQGEGAIASIVQGINRLEQESVDVIIVGRGGGSIEDLWAFNEEEVARAIFACPIPIISAVGHETDVTISDYVADMRAPTPSAAAELAVFDYRDFLQDLSHVQERMGQMMRNQLERKKILLENMSLRMERLQPLRVLAEYKQRLEMEKKQMKDCMDKRLQFEKQRLQLAAQRLHGLSPLTKLESGFSYVTNEQKKNIKSVHQVESGEIITIAVSDGQMDAKILEVRDGRK